MKLQKFDRDDIEGIYPLYCSVLKHFSASSSHVFDSITEQKATYVKPENTPVYNPEELQEYKKAHEKLLNLSVEEKLTKIRDFLISLTAKDCSIFLTIQLVEDKTPKEHHSDSPVQVLRWKDENGTLLYKVRVGDLDLKPFSKIPYQKDLDEQILRQFVLDKHSTDQLDESLF